MKESKKHLLREAYMDCIEYDKSTEFMIAYMQGYADVSFDEALDYIMEHNKK